MRPADEILKRVFEDHRSDCGCGNQIDPCTSCYLWLDGWLDGWQLCHGLLFQTLGQVAEQTEATRVATIDE